MDKIKQNEKGSNTLLNGISVLLTSILSAISGGTNYLLSLIRDLLLGASTSQLSCSQVSTSPIKLANINDCKKGLVITNNQNTDLYIGFDSSVNGDCFTFHLRPAESINTPQDYLIIEKEEYYGEVWAVTKANPTWGTVNTTKLNP